MLSDVDGGCVGDGRAVAIGIAVAAHVDGGAGLSLGKVVGAGIVNRHISN